MPRYFFHILDGDYQVDDLGAEHAGLDGARECATRQIAELIAASGRSLWDRDRLRLWVTDEKGATLFTLALQIEDAAERTRFDRIPGADFFSDPRLKRADLID